MTPREFLSAYGSPVPRTVPLLGGGSHTVEADPDRYVLVWWQTSVNVLVRYGGDPEGQTVPWIWRAGIDPIEFDHAHSGALCCSPYTITAADGPATITYLVGRMAWIGRRRPPLRSYRATRNQ
jgi:hypothetical protein